MVRAILPKLQYPPVRRLLLAFCVFAFAGETLRADFQRVQKQGDLEASLVLETAPEGGEASDRISIRLSGEVLTLEITGPADLEVSVPKALVETKNWLSASISQMGSALLPDSRRRWRGVFRLEPDRPGQASLQLGALTARTSKETHRIQWPAIPVTVITSIERASPDELIEETSLLPYEGWQESAFRVPIWVAVLLLAIGFTAIACLRYRQRRRLQHERPASWLRRRLAQLRAQNLDTPERIVRFYTDLADLLRHYLERRFGLPAPSRTTREFLGDIQNSSALAVDQRALLEQFLRHCDLVKFAHELPSRADCDHAAELVQRFVEESPTNTQPTVPPIE
jgi:hypothetical protein